MRTEAEFALALKQQRLLLRSEALRSAIAGQARVLEAPLDVADRARALSRWLYAQRAWIAVAAVAIVVVRPRRAWRVARWGWWAWRRARRVHAMLVAAGLVAAVRQGSGDARERSGTAAPSSPSSSSSRSGGQAWAR